MRKVSLKTCKSKVVFDQGTCRKSHLVNRTVLVQIAGRRDSSLTSQLAVTCRMTKAESPIISTSSAPTVSRLSIPNRQALYSALLLVTGNSSLLDKGITSLSGVMMMVMMMTPRPAPFLHRHPFFSCLFYSFSIYEASVLLA